MCFLIFLLGVELLDAKLSRIIISIIIIKECPYIWWWTTLPFPVRQSLKTIYIYIIQKRRDFGSNHLPIYIPFTFPLYQYVCWLNMVFNHLKPSWKPIRTGGSHGGQEEMGGCQCDPAQCPCLPEREGLACGGCWFRTIFLLGGVNRSWVIVIVSV